METVSEYLERRREAITQQWVHAVQTSPDLTTPDRLPVPQLIDHIPELFGDLAECLRGEPVVDAADPAARAHGKHRWEQNFRLDELLRELLLLRRIVLRGIDAYLDGLVPRQDTEFESHIRRRARYFFEEAIVRSTEQFSNQQKAQTEMDKALLAGLHQSAQDVAAQLQDVDAARLRLLRVIAHELRNLLNSASLTASGLAAEKDREWREELQRMLGRSLRQMTALVGQLLDVAPLLSGIGPLTLSTLDLSEFAAQVRSECGHFAAAKGLVFEVRTARDIGTFVTDEAKLQSIVTNVVQNALKYTREGSVFVEFSRWDGSGLEIRVTDTGPGIPPENHARIFEEFHREPGAQNQEGTGLGLAIVRQLVELLGGEIQVESAVGQGATFRVLIPDQVPLQA